MPQEATITQNHLAPEPTVPSPATARALIAFAAAQDGGETSPMLIAFKAAKDAVHDSHEAIIAVSELLSDGWVERVFRSEDLCVTGRGRTAIAAYCGAG